jgi:hypothetical protein
MSKKCKCKEKEEKATQHILLDNGNISIELKEYSGFLDNCLPTWSQHVLHLYSALKGLGYGWTEEQDEQWKNLINTHDALI